MSGCVAVLAHSGDALGQRLVETWPGGRARLMTPANLASWGLYWSLGGDGSTEAECRAATRERTPIVGLLALMDAVESRDLPHVAPDDRAYVAGETTAFLSAWLHASNFPKLNPPSLTSLVGERRQVVWRALALRCGLGATDHDAMAPSDPTPGADSEAATITVIGDREIGGQGEDLAWARAVASAARLPMCSVTLAPANRSAPSHGPMKRGAADQGVSGHERTFVRASALPDLSDPEIALAVADWFAERSA